MASRHFLWAVILGCVALGGCATTPEQVANNDPIEPFNRAIFSVNNTVTKYVAVPVGQVYVHVVPKPVRTGLHNALVNLGSPVTFANDLLQGSPSRAMQTFYRFGVNSTLGLGGLFDVAGKIEGVPSHTEDFGQTLGVYGVKEGPFLVLPFFGPAPPRDLAGHFVDPFLDPLFYMDFEGKHSLLVTRHFTGLIDGTSQAMGDIKQLENSADPYAVMRSAYRQHRDSEIRNGEPDKDLPEITPELILHDKGRQ